MNSLTNCSVVERPGVGLRIAPPRLHPLRKVRQCDAVVPFDDLGDGRPDSDAGGPRREEPGAMGGVLDVVREGDHLAVVVVARPLGLTQRNAQQAGGAGADDDQRLARSAVRTVTAQPHRPCLAATSGLDRDGPEDADQAFRLARGAGRDVGGLNRAARAAHRHVEAAHAGRRSGREQVRHVDVAEEEAVVEHPQIAFEALLRGTLDGAPAGDVTLAALDEGQVNRGFVRLQVVEEAQPPRRRSSRSLLPPAPRPMGSPRERLPPGAPPRRSSRLARRSGDSSTDPSVASSCTLHTMRRSSRTQRCRPTWRNGRNVPPPPFVPSRRRATEIRVQSPFSTPSVSRSFAAGRL